MIGLMLGCTAGSEAVLEDRDAAIVFGYEDLDGDGYGDPAAPLPPGDRRADNGEDCDDTDASISPSAEEICDGIDNNCDGNVDESGDSAWGYLADTDRDGYGDPEEFILTCPRYDGSTPYGYVGFSVSKTDCDDTDPAIHPDAEELCDGIDNDCDDAIDESGPEGSLEAYRDGDGDGYGDPEDHEWVCSIPSGYVDNSDDCNDDEPAVWRDSEQCGCHDGKDNDSDGLTDCEDGECFSDARCSEQDCTDGRDSDYDGLTDCMDDECWGTADCTAVVGEAQVFGGNLRGWVTSRALSWEGSRSNSTSRQERQTSASHTATGVWGSARLVSPVNGTSTTCAWTLDRASWGGSAWYRGWREPIGTDSSHGTTMASVHRSGFALSPGCTLSVSTANLLPPYLGAGVNNPVGNPVYRASIFYPCALSWYAPAHRSTASTAGATTRYTGDGTSWSTWSTRSFTGSVSTGDAYHPGACP